MQEFLKLLTSWGKVCPFLRMYGAILLEYIISAGPAANNGTGDILNFLAPEKRITTHHVLQILKGYKHHHKPFLSNNAFEHVFAVKHALWLSRGGPSLDVSGLVL